uniref:RRM domain-containing protein n=1 Tax=Oryza brachyantha TaxID=4533 RepID=J3KYL0_ORYBR
MDCTCFINVPGCGGGVVEIDVGIGSPNADGVTGTIVARQLTLQWSLWEGQEGEEEVEEVEVEEEVEVDEEEELESDAASIHGLLDSFPKDQLVELLRDAAVAHEDVLTAIRRAADADPAQRKIFVHGLGWDATSETLTEAFSPYGEIEDLRVVTDRATGKCKGYGFILFSRRSGARAALREPQKKIGNRTTACQLASVGPVPPGGMPNIPAPTAAPAQLVLPPVSEYTQRKIFVSNVGADIDPQKLLLFFSKYGEIEEGPLGLDKATGKPKGFALFVYKTLEGAKKALQEPHKQFEGVVLHCQKAIDGPKPNKGGGLGGLYGAGTSGGRKGAAGYGAHSHSLPGAAVGGHVMTPPVSSLASLPGGVAGGPGVNPALGQALTALLASQGGGLGLNNILGVGANGSGLTNPGASAALGGSGLPGGYLGGYGGGGGYGGTPPGGPGRNYMGH